MALRVSVGEAFNADSPLRLTRRPFGLTPPFRGSRLSLVTLRALV